MKNKSHKPERLLVAILLLLSFITNNLFAQPITPIKGQSFLLNGVYYSNIDIEFVFSKEYLDALNSGLVFDIDLDFLVVNVRKRRFNREIGKLSQTYTLKYNALTQRYTILNVNTGRIISRPNIESALQYLGSIRNLPTIDDSLITIDQNYQVYLQISTRARGLPSWIKTLTFWRENLDFVTEWIKWPLYD
tara:strand:- start:52 stop:624 length:573 start_codon:yes stop_codon:yes gene_type:complete